MTEIQTTLFNSGHMNIGIVGSRRRNSKEDKSMLEKAFFKLLDANKLNKEDATIISGGCYTGADRFAEEIARKHRIEIRVHKADWSNTFASGALVKTMADGSKYNVLAGIWRNTLIVNSSDMIIALPAGDRSGGTEDVISKANKLKRPIIIV